MIWLGVFYPSFSLAPVLRGAVGLATGQSGRGAGGARQDRQLRIEVGCGLEGALPDAIAKRPIDQTITPRFAQGNYAGGTVAQARQRLSVIDGEPLPAPFAGPHNCQRAFELCCGIG